MLEKLFKLKENKTKISTEILAGVSTFIAISYIIFINPLILSESGMNYGAVFSATILTSIIGTLIMGLYANVPYVQSAALGINSLFTYTICGTLGFSWQQALAMVFICSIVQIIVTLTSLRKKIIAAIPGFMQDAITVGIGLFITYTGFRNGGLIEFSVSNIYNGIAPGASTIPRLITFNNAAAVVSIIGLLVTIILLLKKNKAAYLFGILTATLIGIPLGVTPLPNFSNYTVLPSIAPTFFKLDFAGLFTAKGSLLTIVMTIFTLAISDIFDTIGTFIGTGKKAGIFKLDKDGNMPKKLEKALVADCVASSFGALLGTSNVTTYVESSVGIECGGRTGLSAVVASICFFLALFLSPLIACVPMAAISPVLILIGLSMLSFVKNISWEDYAVAIPAFFTIVLMPFSYSITTGIQIGFIFYIICTKIANKEKKISPVLYIFTLLFIINFIYEALI